MKKEYDVVIIGGGTSGCACAYTCSKNGLKTLLVEKNNYLGGQMTGGLVTPVMKSCVEEINTKFYKKLVSVSKKYNAQANYIINDDINTLNDGWFNPEITKIILEDILTSNDISPNLDILLETTLDSVIKKDGVIKKIVLSSRLLSIPIEANYFVDATGLAELAFKSGCKFIKDEPDVQQNTLRFIVGNVDIEKFCSFLLKADFDRNITNTYRNDLNTNNQLLFTSASTWDTNKKWPLDKYLKKAVDDGVLLDLDRAYFQIFAIAGGYGQVSFNCPRIKNFKDNPYKNSIEIINAKKAIYRLFCFAKRYFEGFENAIITNIAPITGVREENRVKTKYIYKNKDLIKGKTFKNPVLKANYGIDVHTSKNKTTLIKQVTSYELPIESLISLDTDNLFVIGKNVGAEFLAHSALRVQKSCMSMGEAVGNYIKNIIPN